ncbi:Hsp70 family protein [Polyangium aurulentum]|uniref:Hsp70 family protein n=1 Tax=Polyangium aurulentum TaxID=2567896 RepID=UPI0010ADF731|nr:Hsp70 family protein [Polyangium aurulentum]UQA59330.1 Hsp70 family protein [Polyangium aurulentum]
MKNAIVGIDLGTTFSLVSTLRDGVPVVLPNALGELLTPSAVSITDDGTVLIGAPARARATTHPTRTALAFKRDMGTDKQIDLGLRKMSPQELSSLVLGTLKRDAEAALGCAVEEAVITVPAYFGDLQRQATKDAGAIAGLKVERIINEPTAAALAYGLHERNRELRAVVLDLGGGTFDVTVLEIIEGVIEIQSTAGDARLGGEDFDAALAEHVIARIKGEQRADLDRDPRARARIKEAAEGAKKRLSEAESTRVALVDLPLGGGRTTSFELWLTREQVDDVWAPVLERMRGPIQRALRDASLTPDRIDEVLLVGGSTRMPAVARLAAQMFGRLPLRKLPPDEAVAMGAAVQAALKTGDAAVEDMVVTDVAPFTMGISSSTQLGTQRVTGIYSPILERGTVIPASRVERFYTVGDDQQQILIEVYQGEHSLCRDNVKLGEYQLKGLPRGSAGEQGVDVRFTYDMNGILEVDMTIVSLGKTETLVIEKSPGRLSPAQIKAARDAMARLKFHPRDALPNATALARADALFVELSGPDREALGAALAVFRAALEGQDDREIETRRDRLNGLVESLRRR